MIQRFIQAKARLTKLFVIAVITLFPLASDAAIDAKKGEELFNTKCASCHNLWVKATGPALGGVTTRRTEEWLVKWIRNNEKLRKEGDADALAIYKEFNNAAMSIFENLADDDIKSILAYIGEAKPPAPKAAAVTPTEQGGSSNLLYIFIGLLIILFTLFFILRNIKSTLKRMDTDQEEGEGAVASAAATPGNKWFEKIMPASLRYMNPTVRAMMLGTLFLLVGGLYAFVWGNKNVGVQQGYAPTQPIKFSHQIHAGKLALDCKYCHSGVEKSKSATIPALNTCMNCHKGVQLRDRYNGDISPEIKKIYAAMDYDPERPAGKEYGPKASPVKWIRIHNLPDHAYFNHSQHVKVANLPCQKCHGPVEKMEVVQQWQSLQMGWCISCHRETGIDVASNNYYEKLHKFAKQDLEKNGKSSRFYNSNGSIRVTEAMNGGLECSKCHY